MKTLIALIALVSTSAFAAKYDYVAGDKVQFQAEGTSVSALWNKTLCLDGDVFKASFKVCSEFSSSSEARCLGYETVNGTQPVVSTKLVCVDEDSKGCIEFAEKPFIQTATKTVLFKNNNGKIVKRQTVTIPNCQ